MVNLPAFPWSRLAPHAERARMHHDGIVDLSLGTPVDASPDVVRAALAAASDAPGMAPVEGSAELRGAAAGWLARRWGVTVDPGSVLPVPGTKELIASLPTQLGVGPGDTVGVPRLAFPTYEVGVRFAGAEPGTVDPGDDRASWPRCRMVWLNSPSNPDGRVLPAGRMREIVDWARERGTLVVNDECYLEHGWDVRPTSILHPDVCGTNQTGVLAVHSLSKRSNMMGYRAGFVTGDPAVVGELRTLRRQLGTVLSVPVAAAATAALGDDRHVDRQRERYLRRRFVLRDALRAAGYRIDGSDGSLFLWATRGEPCWDTVDHLAGECGVLVSPGEFYGPAGVRHVRVALTATDERVEAAAARIADCDPVPTADLSDQFDSLSPSN